MDIFQPAPSGHRAIAAFQDELHSVCGAFQIQPWRAQRQLEAHLSVQQFGGLDIAHVGLNAEYVERNQCDIRRDPGDHFFLILQREGCADMAQNGRAATIGPGDMFLVDSTQPCRFELTAGYSLQLSVHLPRAEMLHRYGRRIFGGHMVDRRDPLGVSMRALLAKLCVDDSGIDNQVREAFFSVFGALLTERAQQSAQDVNPDRLIVQQALIVIAENAHDPEFSTADLAARLNISLRKLQRAFQTIHETPHSRLQACRVADAQRRLSVAQKQGQKVNVSAVAFQSGFADLSTFYRLYRKVYGHAPGFDAGFLTPSASSDA